MKPSYFVLIALFNKKFISLFRLSYLFVNNFILFNYYLGEEKNAPHSCEAFLFII